MSNAWGRHALASLLVVVCLTGEGAESARKKSSKSKPSAGEKEKVSLRLPRFFASIVDSDQRAAIYEIQMSYRDEILELRQALAALESEQLEEIEAVLSDTQLETLAAMRAGKKPVAERSTKRAASSSKGATSNGKTATKSAPKKRSTKSSSSPRTSSSKSAKSASAKSAKSKSRRSTGKGESG